MPKTPPLPAWPLPVRPAGAGLADWLKRELRAVILEDRLTAEARLPSSRCLAQQLGISRGTVTAAYEQLAEEEYVRAVTGDGTRVLSSWKAASVGRAASAWRGPGPVTPGRLSRQAALWQDTPFPMENSPPGIFLVNVPSVVDFPIGILSRLLSRRLHRATRELLWEQDPLGYRPLRDAIAAPLRETRGLRCTGESVMIVSGTQMAFELTARVLLDPGDAVWVEDPGYPGASWLLAAMGARVVPLPVDGQGVAVESGRRRAPDARLAVVTATHQFPLGVALALPRRAVLLDGAQQ